jgi:hypothetical protein
MFHQTILPDWINLKICLIFLSQYYIFYWSPEFKAALSKNPTNTITLRRTTSKEIFPPTGWRTFIYIKKIRQNATQAIFRVLLGDPNASSEHKMHGSFVSSGREVLTLIKKFILRPNRLQTLRDLSNGITLRPILSGVTVRGEKAVFQRTLIFSFKVRLQFKGEEGTTIII